jgi:hypothetical protein
MSSFFSTAAEIENRINCNLSWNLNTLTDQTPQNNSATRPPIRFRCSCCCNPFQIWIEIWR